MAYIRMYRAMAAGQGDYVGDPGFSLKKMFKIPKKLRKLQPGKIIGKALPVAAGFVPGVGPMLQGFMQRGGPAQVPSSVAPQLSPEFLGLMRVFQQMGLLQGDPGFNWSGVAKGALGVGSMFLPGIVGKAIQGAGKFLPAIAGGIASGAAGAGIGALIAGRGGGGARSYRRMNVGNVRALRRSMRRVEGFAKLARQTISFTSSTRMKKRGRKR
jgi:hypothetical protein